MAGKKSSFEVNPEVLTRIPENLQAVANAAFRATVDYAYEEARKYAGNDSSIAFFFRRSGKFVKSIRRTPYIQLGPDLQGEQRISSNHPGARIHSLGGTIVPRRGPYLTFRLYATPTEVTPSGPWVRTRRVNIPARPFLEPAAADAVKHWPLFCKDAISRILGQL